MWLLDVKVLREERRSFWAEIKIRLQVGDELRWIRLQFLPVGNCIGRWIADAVSVLNTNTELVIAIGLQIADITGAALDACESNFYNNNKNRHQRYYQSECQTSLRQATRTSQLCM